MPFASQLWTGLQIGWEQYAIKTEKQTYQYTDGSTTQADVHFSSNIFQVHTSIGYDLIKSGKIIPYITIKGGITNFYTHIYIEGIHEEDPCHPLNNKNVFGNVTLSGYAGIGARIDGQKLFKSRRKNWALNFSVNYLTGGTLDFLNVKQIQSNDPNTVTKEFTVKFVNVTTNQIHEHKIAEVFTSTLQQINIKLGLTIRL